MKKKTFVIFLAASCVVLTILSFSPVQAAKELIPVFTPAAGGTAYTLGAGIVAVTNRYLSDIELVHMETTGSLDIVRRMQERENMNKPCFGIFATPDAWRAYKGMGTEYAGKPFPSLRSVVFVNGSDQYFAVPASSSIKAYGDAKGKRIGVGGAGSTVASSALFFFEQHGVSKSDFSPYYFVYKETVEGIQDGSLDGGILGGGYPISAYVELSTRMAMRIVPVDEKVIARVAAEQPYYYRAVIKAGSYKGLDKDVTTYGFTTAVHTYAGMSPDLVYRFLKNLFDHREDYYSIHKSAREMTAETATKGFSVPVHPGAERYLKEIGAMR